jgi:hypothetical protein
MEPSATNFTIENATLSLLLACNSCTCAGHLLPALRVALKGHDQAHGKIIGIRPFAHRLLAAFSGIGLAKSVAVVTPVWRATLAKFNQRFRRRADAQKINAGGAHGHIQTQAGRETRPNGWPLSSRPNSLLYRLLDARLSITKLLVFKICKLACSTMTAQSVADAVEIALHSSAACR